MILEGIYRLRISIDELFMSDFNTVREAFEWVVKDREVLLEECDLIRVTDVEKL